MKRGFHTSEFWWGLTLSIGIYLLLWTGRYPSHGTPGYEGVDWLIYLWFAYTGFRSYSKRLPSVAENEKTTPPTAIPTK